MSQVQIYRSSPVKGLVIVVSCAAFAAMGLQLLDDRPLVAWAAILFFGGMGLLNLFSLLTGGASLTLGHKGFEIASSAGRTRIRWDEIERLAIVQSKLNRTIGVKYLRAHRKSGISRALTGTDLAIVNIYRVPLVQVCETMNTYRDRYLGAIGAAQFARPAGAMSGPAPAAVSPSAGTARARPVLLAFGAAFLVLVLNIVLRLMLKVEGMPVTMGIAFGVGGLVMTWFLFRLKRAPLPRERSRFLWTYSALIALPCLGLYLVAAATHGDNIFMLLIVALHAVAYPAAAQFFLSDKRFGAMRETIPS